MNHVKLNVDFPDGTKAEAQAPLDMTVKKFATEVALRLGCDRRLTWGLSSSRLGRGLDPEQTLGALGIREEDHLFVSPEATAGGGLDPLVIVSLVNLGSAALVALVTGLVAFANTTKASRITIQRRDGSRLEFPVGISEAELAKYIALMEENPPQNIEISPGP